jgi:DNA (cytosine-5)-methyltransferase 1
MPIDVVDLFCGAGGMSQGFASVGFRVVAAFDSWEPAIRTHNSNLGNHATQVEIHSDIKLPQVDVIIGGPPCQGFSSAGARRKGDCRNTLVSVFANLVAQYLPKAFVFENVEGFVTNDEGRFVLDLLDPVIEAGYHVHLRKVNAANFGVPQHRKRVVAIGGLGWSPGFPSPTHSAWGAPGALSYASLPRTPTLRNALSDLPAPELAARGDRGDGLDHVFPALSELDMERSLLLEPGQRMCDLPEELWHESYRRRAFRRVKDGTPSERRGGAPSGVRRLVFDEPCKAITGGAQNEFLHPEEHRPLTIRECARIQTFPDSFHFIGTRSERLQLIGNSVPPTFANAIAAQLIANFPREDMRSHGAGRLLSFDPTASSGMSPALDRVCQLVRARHGEIGGLFANVTF